MYSLLIVVKDPEIIRPTTFVKKVINKKLNNPEKIPRNINFTNPATPISGITILNMLLIFLTFTRYV